MREGNWTPAAEFNIWVDPEAARIVFRSGLPITMVGLDVTHRALFREPDIERLVALGTPVARVFADLIRFFARFHAERYGWDGSPIHDAVAVAHVAVPGLVRTERYHVDVETAGRADPRPHGRGQPRRARPGPQRGGRPRRSTGPGSWTCWWTRSAYATGEPEARRTAGPACAIPRSRRRRQPDPVLGDVRPACRPSRRGRRPAASRTAPVRPCRATSAANVPQHPVPHEAVTGWSASDGAVQRPGPGPGTGPRTRWRGR